MNSRREQWVVIINKAATKMGSQGVTAGLKIAADEKSSKNFKDMWQARKGYQTRCQ